MNVLMNACFLIGGLITSSSVANDRVFFDFADANSRSWRSVNDGVMGGRSSGQSQINSDGKLEFTGYLSLANNGGFASIRTTGSKLGMNPSEAIRLRVKGDGRKYNLNLYSQANLGGYSFRQSFQTKKNEWIEVDLPIDQFRATWRGRSFSRIKLEPKDVKGMGILLGDKKAGKFKLEVEWIKAVTQNDAND